MKAVKVGNIGTDHDGYPPTKVTAGSPDVFIDGLPAARVGDPLEPHDKPNSPMHSRAIATGSSTVFINGKPAALTGGAVSCGGVTIGTGTVNIGDVPPPPSQASAIASVPETLGETANESLYGTASTTTSPAPKDDFEDMLQRAAKGHENTIGPRPDPKEIKPFELTDIPDLMRKTRNWPKSAELMELWFSLPAQAMKKGEKIGDTRANQYPQEYVNTTMFTWSWLEQFKQVPEARDQLISTLSTNNAINELKTLIINYLGRTPHLEPTTYQVTNELLPVELHSNWQFQRSDVGYGKVMNDLYGSLGNFALYAAITKATIIKTTNHKLTPNNFSVHITEVGLYMRDTYEFIGEQYLGHWGNNGLRLNYLGGVLNKFDIEYNIPKISVGSREYFDAIGNADYRQYREETGLGGDLLLFSDVKTLPVDINFKISAQ